jgi:hypothetical protein
MNTVTLDASVLLDIINIQAEVTCQGLDLGGVIQLVRQRAAALCHADGAAVEMGIAQAQLGLRLGRDGSLSGLCVANNEIRARADSETDPRVDLEACRKVGLRSMLVVPLRHEHQTAGVLKIVSSEPRAEDLAARLGASTGFALWPDAGRDMEQPIELAGQAMYRVKHARRPGAGALHG